MEDIVDLIATDGSASDISAAIKNALFAKAAEKVDEFRPIVAGSMFDEGEEDGDEETTGDDE